MEILVVVTIVIGIIVGSAMLSAAIFVYVKHRHFSIGGIVLTTFGTILLGLSVWKTVTIEIDSNGKVIASFESKLKAFTTELKQSNQRIKKNIIELKEEVKTAFTTFKDKGISSASVTIPPSGYDRRFEITAHALADGATLNSCMELRIQGLSISCPYKRVSTSLQSGGMLVESQTCIENLPADQSLTIRVEAPNGRDINCPGATSKSVNLLVRAK